MTGGQITGQPMTGRQTTDRPPTVARRDHPSRAAVQHPPAPPGVRRDHRRLGHVGRLGGQGTHRAGRQRARARGRGPMIVPERDYAEHLPTYEMPYRGWNDRRALAAEQPVQRECYACDEVGSQVLRQRHREPVHDRPRQALPVDPRAAGGRPVDHVGAPVLPAERPRLRSERARGLRGRLAHPLRRPGALVRPRRGVRRHQRARGGAGPRAGRRLPAAHADVVRGGACGGRDRQLLRAATAS